MENDIIDNHIIYTPEEAAAAIEDILGIHHTTQHILDMHNEPRDPNKWEVAARKVRDVLDFLPYKLQNTKTITFAELCELGQNLLLHGNSKDWMAYLKPNNYCLPQENTCSFLIKNFNTAILQDRGIDAVSYRPDWLLLTVCGLAWLLFVAISWGRFI